MKNKTKIISLLIALVMMATLISVFAIPSSAAGYSGTPAESVPKIDSKNYKLYGLTSSNWKEYNGYYAITTAEEFYKWVERKTGRGNAALFADIVINAVNVHTADPATLIPFDGFQGGLAGTFDGRGHSISGIYMNENAKSSAVALFDQINSTGAFKNTVIKNSLFDVGSSSKIVATIACDVYGTISNVLVEEDVKIYAAQNCGGITYCPGNDATIKNVVFLGCITLKSSALYAGALFSSDSESSIPSGISNCYYIYGRSTGKTGESLYAVGYNQISKNFEETIPLNSTSDSHTCVGLTRSATASGCYVNGNTEYTECMICDKLMSGSKSTTPVSHNYLPATCAAPKTCSGCGATEGNVDPTKHTGNSIPATCTTDKLCESCGASVGGKNPSRHTEAPTYEILENNENHKNIYGCCGASTNETHSFPEGGACVCGAEPKVKVSKNDAEEEYYFTIAKAFSGLKNSTESDGAVVTLLSDLVMGDNDDITGGVFTIDLNGKSMTAAEDNNSAIYFNGYPHITIKDSGTNGSINGHVYCLVISNGTVIIEGGIFNCSSNEFDLIKAVRSELIIKGGTFNSSGDGVYAEPESTAVISGGVFNCASSDLWGYDGNISIVTDENGGPSFIGDLKTNTSIVSILDSDSFLYDSEGNLIALDETTEDIFTGVVVSKGADLTGATLTVNGEYVFIGKNITPTDVVVEFNGRIIDPEDYTISYSDNLYVGTATLTITGVAPFTGSASTTFEIGKGTLRIVLPPEANHEFGDSYEGKTLTGGRVSIVGNNDAVVNGSWSWVGDGKWVTFMPDASYDGLFEELNSQIEATVYVSPASPVITLIAPSPSIMPGMSIQFKVEVKNPYDESLTELPRSFKIFYKTGENGTEVATDGLEFTLLTDVTIGEVVYVYVENLAVDGMYHIARSQVIELTVGMIDYSEAIDNAVAELNVLIDTKADQATVEKAIERLENLVVNAEAAAKSYADEKDGELNTALTKAIGNAKTELTEAYTEAINNAKEALQELIDKKADQATLEKAIEDLNELIKKAEESAKTYSDEKDSQLNASLSSAITTARDELTRAYTKAIENAKKALEDKMKALDASLTSEIEALEKLLEKAQRDLETADEENREALEKATADAAKALAEANDKLERAIVNAEYRLGLKDKELERQTSKLTTALIVVGVVAGVALAGNTALITWVVVNRRKLTLNKKEDK